MTARAPTIFDCDEPWYAVVVKGNLAHAAGVSTNDGRDVAGGSG